MVGHDVLEPVKPECREAREHLPLVGNLVWKDNVKRANAVTRDHEQAVATVVDVTNLTTRIRAKLHSPHMFSSHRVLLPASLRARAIMIVLYGSGHGHPRVAFLASLPGVRGALVRNLPRIRRGPLL